MGFLPLRFDEWISKKGWDTWKNGDLRLQIWRHLGCYGFILWVSICQISRGGVLVYSDVSFFGGENWLDKLVRMWNRISGCWLVSIRMMTFQRVFGHWSTSTLGSKKPLPKLKILGRLGVIWDQVQHFGHTLDGDPKSEELTAFFGCFWNTPPRKEWDKRPVLQTQTGYCRIFLPIGQLFLGKTSKIYYSSRWWLVHSDSGIWG